MDALAALRSQLQLTNKKLQRETFANTKAMETLAGSLARQFGAGAVPETDAVTDAVERFLSTGRLETFRDIKLACYGVSVSVGSNQASLLERPQLADELLRTVRHLHETQPRRFRRCFRALLTAYFEHNPFAKGSEPTFGPWQKIRDFLRGSLDSILQMPRSDWVEALSTNRNLLTEDPCQPYGKSLLEGNLQLFEDVCDRVGVSTNSWIRQQVIFAALRAACESGDQVFRDYIEKLIDLFKANPAVQVTGVKNLLDRYARMESRPEHIPLRIYAIELLGNPLLTSNVPRWEGVSSDTKKMVADWLKLRLIEQFFELLSQDGATDKRRVKFWAQYVPVIENIWFVLGSNARSNWNPDFKKLRDLMGDQALTLDGATSGNNAFIMKIGHILVVEFGETGNAAYLFDANDPPFDFHGHLHLRTHLKDEKNLNSLRHYDGHRTWEDKFRQAIKKYSETRSWPEEPHQYIETQTRRRESRKTAGPGGGVFTPTDFDLAFKRFCAERGLKFTDNRPKGGNLVVYADSQNPKVAGTLGQWGFKYVAAGTCWIKWK